jgi:hypothetical protein
MLPAHCDVCSRSTLVDEQAIRDGRATCKACATPLRTLPGESYADDDVTLFDQIESTLHEAGISALNAAQLAAELDGRSRITPGRALRRVVLALPSLGLLEVLVAQEPASLRKVEGIMATLLEALASSRSQSGVISTRGAGIRFGPGSASGS